MHLPAFVRQLPADIRIRLGQKRAGRQRVMVADGHLLLILHKVPQRDNREREGVFFWRRPDGSWVSEERNGVTRLMEHVEEYEALELELEHVLERAQDASDYYRLLGRIVPLQHAAQSLYGALQAARESVVTDRDLIDLRDWAYDISRASELLYVNTRHALDYQTAKKAEEEARLSTRGIQIATRLNILMAVFLPLTALASIFGMNARSGLEESMPGLFWSILFAGVFLGVCMSWWAINGLNMRRLLKGQSEKKGHLE